MSISNGFPGTVKLATSTMSGLMSSSDKIKLDKINPGEIEQTKETIEEIKNQVIDNYIYTVRINLNDKNPYTAVSYQNDAYGFEPLYVNQSTGECNYGSWKNIIDSLIRPKPCLLKDSKVITYLDPENYSRTIYGSGADIINESSGDVMIEFAKLPYKIEKNGNIIDFSICTRAEDDSWSYTAFLSEDGLSRESDYMYYSAYEGWIDSDNKLRSLSDKIPTADKPIFTYRDYSKNNGISYSMVSIAKRMYVTLLTIMVTKSLDVKTSIGLGVSDLNYTGDNKAIKSGTMNTKGLFYGDNTGRRGIKVFGIENFIGNLAEFTDGLVRLQGQLYSKTSYWYSDTGSGYRLIGDYPPKGSGWVKSVIISDQLLIPSEYDASSTDYFTSYVYMPEDDTLDYVCALGGSYYMNQSCGLMCMDFRYESETTSQATGSRIISCSSSIEEDN